MHTTVKNNDLKTSAVMGIPLDLLFKMNMEAALICSSHIVISQKWDWCEGWIFAMSSSFCFVMSRILAKWKNPGILRERDDVFKHKNTKPYDKIMGPLMMIGIILLPVAAGLDMRYQLFLTKYSNSFKFLGWSWLAASYFLSTYALTENPFFSSIMRIQHDRCRHVVVVTGPYRWIRHPGYSSALCLALGTPLVLESGLVFFPALVLILVTFLRTKLEDDTLQDELKGYVEYTQSVPFRLIPNMW